MSAATGPDRPPQHELTIVGVGEVIRLLRTRAGWTVDRLAEAVQSDGTTLSNYEADTTRVPYQLLKRIGQVLGIATDELFDELVAFARSRGIPLPTYTRAVESARLASPESRPALTDAA